MQELYDMSLSFHKFFAYVSFGLTLLHLVLTQVGSGAGYVKRIRLFLPLYYASLAILFITGATILPILYFKLSFSIIVMMASFVVIIGFGAMGYKKLKRVYFTKNYSVYKANMRIFIGINLALILISSFI